MTDKIWTTIDLIKWGEDYFVSKGISNAKLEVEWFLCHILNCQRIDLYVQFEEPLMKDKLFQFKEMVKRRIEGEPFQHILGKADFYGRDFIVNKHVLIPRPETEIIIELLKKRDGVESILEIGTGSGCIATTISLENLATSIIATDISKDALNTAKENASQLSAENIDFKIHDFLNTDINSTFDVVVSNPPYIGSDEMDGLQKEVQNYDPKIALTDNGDGLSFYRRFAEFGHSLLNKNGFMLLEFGGVHQVKAITEIFESQQFNVKFHNDLQGDPRIVEMNLLTQ
ncbi:MAG: peptide chain release factor N(5)-glutamine methyltransferase [Candidatus Marinimicrobia bacterium]|jgi:release factor glutamine methyltransferase|nr:peptide chain release factor N(5)-glutamine methyltransferase [Candidatus Neomarinimicrobiota bacterium]MBT6870068.1 peptide chain release factor N(5)-glutamine methyltransferase [Candidatus Neomarinimicrobiota bacterium]|tara:strand:+ start:8577 stop:9431 length:855 start_codon:yes stop_codon:yes gene_type:complete